MFIDSIKAMAILKGISSIIAKVFYVKIVSLLGNGFRCKRLCSSVYSHVM